MNSREKWIRDTRESVLRALAAEGIPLSAGALEGNLDVGRYVSGLGFLGVRSQREISAALRWAVAEGFAKRLPEGERLPDDPPGVCYEVTRAGVTRAQETES